MPSAEQRDMDAPRQQYQRLRTPPSASRKTPRMSSRVPLPRRSVTPSSAPLRQPQWSSRFIKRLKSADNNSSLTTPITPWTDKPLPPTPILRFESLETLPKSSKGLDVATENALQLPVPSSNQQHWPAVMSASGSAINLCTPAINDEPWELSADSPTKSFSPVAQAEQLSADSPTKYASAIVQAVQLSADSPTESVSLFVPAAQLNADPPTKSSSPTTDATPASVVAAAAELTNIILGTGENRTPSSAARSLSSGASYASAAETSMINAEESTFSRKSGRAGSRHSGAPNRTRNATPLPSRTASLRDRLSQGSLIPQAAGSTRKFTTFTDFTKEDHTPKDTENSRPHSPSPASFSCPRSGSISTTTPIGTLKEVKTASRLPIPDGKKATVIDIKPRRVSGGSSKSAQQIPTFGSRRLDPKAADILDHGIKRRQMQRTHRREHSANIWLARAATDASDATTPGTPAASVTEEWTGSDYNTAVKSDEEMTFAQPSSDDDSEIMTPLDRRSSHFFQQATKPVDRTTLSHVDAEASKDIALPFRAPPPTSPFTRLLETIPSQAALPTRSAEDEEEITNTLSHLEGRGSPPKQSIDTGTLVDMFGHLKSAWDKTTHDTANLTQNAAAAEQYLAANDDGSAHKPQPRFSNYKITNSPGWLGEPRLEVGQLFDLEQPMSKWSNTTPSEKEEEAQGTSNLSISQEPPGQPLRRPPPPPPRQSQHARKQASIGYPSRVPVTAETLTPSAQNVVADVPDLSRRQSSPTLGPKPRGSTRATRGSPAVGPPGFARTTQAAQARKTSRLPTPSVNANANAVTDKRGRQPYSTKQSSKRESGGPANIPRGRSKSRHVIDTIGGFFHRKRDKSVVIPPVPPINDNFTNGNVITPTRADAPVEAGEGPTGQPSAEMPPIPELHSSPARRTQPLQTQQSETTLRTEETTLVDASNGGAVSLPDDVPNNQKSIDAQRLTERLIARARAENDVSKKQHLIQLAQALNHSVMHVRGAQINAERAQQSAMSAQHHYELAQASVELIQKLAVGMSRVGFSRRRG